jgi:hypothetical protein
VSITRVIINITDTKDHLHNAARNEDLFVFFFCLNAGDVYVYQLSPHGIRTSAHDRAKNAPIKNFIPNEDKLREKQELDYDV